MVERKGGGTGPRKRASVEIQVFTRVGMEDETLSSTAGSEVKFCDERYIVYDPERGELICTLTGEVLEASYVDPGPEWREFSDTPRNRSRVGGALTSLTHDMGLTTTMSDRDIRRLDGRRRRVGFMMKRRNAANRIAGCRRLVRTLQMLNDEGRRMQLPKRTLETAAMLIKKVVAKGLGRGEYMRAYLAAAFFIASRLTGVPRSFSEIVSRMGVEYERARYAYRRIVEIHGGRIEARVQKPSDFIPKIADTLNLSPGTQTLMYRLCRAVEKLNMTHGRSPIAIAAAIAYISAAIMGEKKRQKDIAEALGGFTDVAVRNRYREIIDNLYIEVSL